MSATERRLRPVTDVLADHGVEPCRLRSRCGRRKAAASGDAVRVLARAARIAGCIPVSTSLFTERLREARARSHAAALAGDDVDGGWRSTARRVARQLRSRTSCSSPERSAVRARAHRLPRAAVPVDALIASVCPPARGQTPPASREHRGAAFQGLRARFEQLLFGDGAVISADAALAPSVGSGQGAQAAERSWQRGRVRRRSGAVSIGAAGTAAGASTMVVNVHGRGRRPAKSRGFADSSNRRGRLLASGRHQTGRTDGAPGDARARA